MNEMHNIYSCSSNLEGKMILGGRNRRASTIEDEVEAVFKQTMSGKYFFPPILWIPIHIIFCTGSR